MKNIRKIISLFLILSLCGIYAYAANPLTWPSDFGRNGREMPFRPYDKYVTHQNPPDFSWPKIDNAQSYDLIIANNQNLTDIAYSKYNIKFNYYNFSYAFNKKTYYWAVRYKTADGLSEWSSPRRFTVSDDAVNFEVPELSVVKAKITSAHPRLYFNSDNINEWKEAFNSAEGKTYISELKNAVSISMNSQKIEEPNEEDYTQNTQSESGKTINDELSEIGNKISVSTTSPMLKSAFLYNILGEEKYGTYAKELLLELSSWDCEGITAYSSYGDMVHRTIMSSCAICYDWIYSLLSAEEKNNVCSMIKKRGEVVYNDLLSDGRIILGTNLFESPYDSHGVNNLGYLILTSISTLGEFNDAEKWFEEAFPLYVNIVPVWGNEDGGFSQGSYYYHCKNTRFFVDAFKESGLIDLSQKPYYRNEKLFPMYNYPKNSYGAFGDYSYIKSKAYLNYIYGDIAASYNDGEAKWLQEYAGDVGDYYSMSDMTFPLDGIILIKNKFSSVKPEIPYQYPKAKAFRDTGFVSMHSDLLDENRISMYFKSSPFGSYNHSHGDQNTFVIEAFGERLAIDSGYYSYGSDWENAYVRQTYAHNGITFSDNCWGQTINSMEAKGKIEQFITSNEFDAVSGDASAAYGGPQYMKRKIIYVRPSSYIIIDNFKNGNSLSYQFWLNGMKDSITNLTDNSVSLVNNNAQLDCNVLYPQVTSDASYDFTLPDKTVVKRPAKYSSYPTQERVWFKTGNLGTTKMVTLLNVHKTGEAGVSPEIIKNNNYIILNYPDGTSAYVNLNFDSSLTINDITFKGDAYVSKGNAKMLVSGDYLKKGNNELLNSEEEISWYSNDKLMKISSDKDMTFKSYIKNHPAVYDENLSDANSRAEINYSYNGSVLCADIMNGDYTLIFDKNNYSNSFSSSVIETVIDGKSENIEAVTVTEGNKSVSYFSLHNEAGYYRIEEKSDEISLKNASVGDIVYLARNQKITAYGKDNLRLVLSKSERSEYPDGTVNITVSAASGGTVSPDGTVTVTKGGTAEFIISPSSNKYIKSVSINGNTLFPDNSGKVKVSGITADSQLNVTFGDCAIANPVYIYEKLAYPDEKSFIAFGGLKNKNNIKEYGIAVSNTYNFDDITYYPAKVEGGENSQFGVKLNMDKVYVRTYAMNTSGKTYYSQRTLYVLNDYSAVYNPRYVGAGSYDYLTEVSYGGTLKEGSLLYSNSTYAAKDISDFLVGADFITLFNPVIKTVPDIIKAYWNNGSASDYFAFDVYKSGTVCVLSDREHLSLETYGYAAYKTNNDNGYMRKWNTPWKTYHDRNYTYIYTKHIYVNDGGRATVNLPNAAWYDNNHWGYFVVFITDD